MKLFLQKISLFLFLGFCLNLFGYFLISKPILDDPYFANINTLIDSKLAAVILGDSHSERVKQRYLNEDIINLGYDSDSFGDMFLKLSYMLKKGIKPNTVIIPADYHMFSSYRTSNDNRRRSIRISDKDDFERVHDPLNHLQFLVQKYVHPFLPLCNSQNNKLILLASIAKIKLLMTGRSEIVDDRKWSEVNKEDKILLRQSRLKKHFQIAISEKEINNLKKLIALCNANQLNIQGLRYPIEYEYHNLIDQSHKLYIDSIYLSLGISIDDQSLRYKEPSFFADQDHLSISGADDFGKYIVNTYSH